MYNTNFLARLYSVGLNCLMVIVGTLIFLFTHSVYAQSQRLAGMKLLSTSQKDYGPVSQGLLKLQKEYETHLKSGLPAQFKSSSSMLPATENWVIIDAVALGDAGRLLADLQALGLQKGAKCRIRRCRRARSQ